MMIKISRNQGNIQLQDIIHIVIILALLHSMNSCTNNTGNNSKTYQISTFLVWHIQYRCSFNHFLFPLLMMKQFHRREMCERDWYSCGIRLLNVDHCEVMVLVVQVATTSPRNTNHHFISFFSLFCINIVPVSEINIYVNFIRNTFKKTYKYIPVHQNK